MSSVYIIETDKKFKIGKADDLNQRMRELQTANPLSVLLIHSFETNKPHEAEKFLHRFFKNKQIRNEWFALSAIDIAFIKTIDGFSDDAFTWTSIPDCKFSVSEAVRPNLIFKFIDGYSKREIDITERQVFDFVRIAWKRQQDKAHPLSKPWWTTQKSPRLKVLHYRAILQILLGNSLVINRHQGTSGDLALPPDEIMAIITDPKRNKNLLETQIL